jgi:hypothetical protein
MVNLLFFELSLLAQFWVGAGSEPAPTLPQTPKFPAFSPFPIWGKAIKLGSIQGEGVHGM